MMIPPGDVGSLARQCLGAPRGDSRYARVQRLVDALDYLRLEIHHAAQLLTPMRYTRVAPAETSGPVYQVLALAQLAQDLRQLAAVAELISDETRLLTETEPPSLAEMVLSGTAVEVRHGQ